MTEDPFEAIKATFFQECEELLADLEAGLLALENGEGDDETINAVFRAVHSVKGGAGAFGMEALVRFAHVFETLMDELRAGRKPCDDATIKTLLRASDVLNDHVAAARGAGAPVDEGRSAGLVAELEALTHGDAAPPAPAAASDADEDEFGFKPVQFDPMDLAPAAAPESSVGGGWRIVFQPNSALYAKANDAGLLLRELARLGDAVVEIDASGVPTLDALEAEEGCLSWTVRLPGAVEEAAIREVFEFVDGDCDLAILRDAAEAPSAEPVAAPVAASEPDLDIAALLAAAQALVETPAEPAALAPEPTPVSAAPAAEVKAPPAAPETAANAPVAQAPVTIRVDLDRVDRLINLVGELVIQQAVLAQRVSETAMIRATGVGQGLEDLELLTREIQDSVMAIRAQPVKSVFQRMPRLVREVAQMTGKQVRLVTEGEATEVDKTVVERLAEPITHMLRNAIDHGLEKPEKRVAAGKAAEGQVRLAALHRSGRIVIEISDDGAGINRERVLGIAVEKGLVEPDAQLSDEQIDNLIFMPGFSTAETISDVSGRGVGMDVVKRSIQSLGGRISIASKPGEGSTFTMSLPLTLAVLDGMVVTSADQTLVAPLAAIVESLTPRPEDIHRVGGHTPVIRFRDEFVPLVDVAATLGFGTGPEPASTGVAVIVEAEGGAKAALLVDAIQGQRQVVIKSLETNYQAIDGVAAATILGDGRVALILDIDALVSNTRRSARKPDLKLAS
ncbi:chemotaxis protein CheA [Brevundimonas sp.]|uniref:chemotaxis protein CheA n=1 Tax=Brevundimonas sp. TaxID=1871086 RepID=UPI001DA93ED5|nr:chemotaxis protein CheA [Brevundimonas sp.]MBA3999738.1 chemotaxis protein CheA [Brevundimonas sp.]